MKRTKMKSAPILLLAMVLTFSFCLSACGGTQTHTHNLEKTSAVVATCEKEGNIEYYKCADTACAKYFSDLGGANEIHDKSSVIIAKQSHNYVDRTDDFQHFRACEWCDEVAGEKQNHGYDIIVEGISGKYRIGDTLAFPMTAEAFCKDCAFVKTLDVTSVMVTGFDSSTIGEKTMKVTVYVVENNEQTKIQKDFAYTIIKPQGTLTFEGFTYDGAEILSLNVGAKLDMAKIELNANKKFSTYYRLNDKLVSIEELAALVIEEISYTITAVYEEDMILYTPARLYENKESGTQKRGVYNDEGSTTYLFNSSVASWKILDGDDKNDGNKFNEIPIVPSGTLIGITFTNNSEYDVTLAFGSEFWGMKKWFDVSVSAGETKTIYVISTLDISSSFKQLDMTSTTAPADTEIELIISGRFINN